VVLAFLTGFGGWVMMPTGAHKRKGPSAYGNVLTSATPAIRVTRRPR
jgi:hypothetical protein